MTVPGNRCLVRGLVDQPHWSTAEVRGRRKPVPIPIVFPYPAGPASWASRQREALRPDIASRLHVAAHPRAGFPRRRKSMAVRSYSSPDDRTVPPHWPPDPVYNQSRRRSCGATLLQRRARPRTLVGGRREHQGLRPVDHGAPRRSGAPPTLNLLLVRRGVGRGTPQSVPEDPDPPKANRTAASYSADSRTLVAQPALHVAHLRTCASINP